MKTCSSFEHALALLREGTITWPCDTHGHPVCDRCDAPATRVAYSTPEVESAVFFCGECDEHDPLEPNRIGLYGQPGGDGPYLHFVGPGETLPCNHPCDPHAGYIGEWEAGDEEAEDAVWATWYKLHGEGEDS